MLKIAIWAKNWLLEPESQHHHWMKRALVLAEAAAAAGEVPVGAVIIDQNGQLVAEAHNRKEQLALATAHAELLAMDQACQLLGRWRLSDCTLYVTLEPCVMCVGAIIQARLKQIVFGASDPKGGAIHSSFQIFANSQINHRPLIVEGVLKADCARLLSDFFARLRNRPKD